jgi:hypothetical protein
LRAAATGPLKGYLKHGELIPEFSRDRVLQTVDAIEGPLRRCARLREPRSARSDTQLCSSSAMSLAV